MVAPLILLVFAGVFKANPLLASLAVDLTLLAAGVLAVTMLGAWLGQRLRLPAAVVPVVMLGAAFLPAAVWAADNNYASAKLTEGFPLMFLAAAAPAFLITTSERLSAWLTLIVLVALIVVTVGALAGPAQQTGTFALAGANTISTAQATGAGLVVVLVLLTTGSGHRLPLLLIAAVLAVPLISTGSRGPTASAAITVVIVALSAPVGREHRVRTALLSGLALLAGAYLLGRSQSAGAERIRDVIYGDDVLQQRSITARVRLWDIAVEITPGVPEGLGWGNFFEAIGNVSFADAGYRQYAHNVILEAFVEGGWLAGVAVLMLLVLGLARLRRAATDRFVAAIYGLAIFATGNAMVSGDIPDNRLLWVSIAIAWTAPTAGGRHAREFQTADSGRRLPRARSATRPGPRTDHVLVRDSRTALS